MQTCLECLLFLQQYEVLCDVVNLLLEALDGAEADRIWRSGTQRMRDVHERVVRVILGGTQLPPQTQWHLLLM